MQKKTEADDKKYRPSFTVNRVEYYTISNDLHIKTIAIPQSRREATIYTKCNANMTRRMVGLNVSHCSCSAATED